MKKKVSKDGNSHHKLRFRDFAAGTANAMGSHWAFIGGCLVILTWALSGPLFGYSDTWQLVVNTGTTVVTFLMVFLIQNTQSRDAKAVHLKLDELIRAIDTARTDLVDLEDLSDGELKRLQNEFHSIRDQAKAELDERQEERDARK